MNLKEATKVIDDLRSTNHNLGRSKNHTEYLLSRSEEENLELKGHNIQLESKLSQFEFQLRSKLTAEEFNIPPQIINSVEGEYKTMDILIQERFPNHKFNDKHELSFKQFDYHDMLDFADHVSTSQMKKKVEEIEKEIPNMLKVFLCGEVITDDETEVEEFVKRHIESPDYDLFKEFLTQLTK